jgi:hypothetical protein
MTSATLEPSLLLIDTPIEPEHSFDGDTLLAAARRNDFRAFEELYAHARDRARWRTLHEVWTYAESERTGAFFDESMRDRLAAAYSGYGAYIDDFRIVDSHGHSYYPSAETRHFLIERAVKEVRPAKSQRIATAVTHRAKKVHASRAKVVIPTPVAHVAAPAARPGPSTTLGMTLAAPVSAAPIVAQPVVPAPAPVQIAAPAPAVSTHPTKQPAPAEDTTAPGILLIVMGLAGIGVMMLILRAPKSAPPSLDLGTSKKPSLDTQPGVKSDVKSSTSPEHRATGSHG